MKLFLWIMGGSVAVFVILASFYVIAMSNMH